MDRRAFLAGAASLSLVPNLALGRGESEQKKKPLRFGFVTDTHLGTPESLRWTDTALATLRKRYPDVRLLVHGGDLLDHADTLPSAESSALVAKWRESVARYGFESRHALGNHDLAAMKSPDDMGHGKAFFKREVGPTNAHIQFGAVDLIFLDTLRIQDDGWDGFVEPFVLHWLGERLEAIPANNPIVLVSHMPLFTIMPQYDAGTDLAPSKQLQVQNAKEVYELLKARRVVATLQGHTHVGEECDDRRTKWITGGAICGDWWKGARFGRYEPGFGVCSWDGESFDYTFETYGWKAA